MLYAKNDRPDPDDCTGDYPRSFPGGKMRDEKKTKAQLIAELNEQRGKPAAGASGKGYPTLCDHIPLGLFRCTRRGELLWTNRILAGMLGCEDTEGLTGIKLRSLFVHPRLRRDFFDRLKAGEGSEGYVAELKRSDGGTFRARLTVQPDPRAGEDAEGFDGLVVDLTVEEEFEEAQERRIKESAVLAALSRELYAAETVQEVLDVAVERLAEIFPAFASVNLVEDGGRYLTVRAHKVASRLLRSSEKITGQPFTNWRIPLFEDSVISETIRTGHPMVYGLNFAPGEPVVETDIRGLIEAMFEKKSPLQRFGAAITEIVGDVAFLGIPFTDSDGEVTGSITVLSNFPFGPDRYNLIKVSADIVGKALEQKRLSQKLHVSLERYRGVFEHTVLGMYRTSPDGRVLMANPALVRMLGYDTFEELSKRDLEQGYQPGYSRADFKRAVEEKGEIRGRESAWTRLDDTSLHVRENARVIRDEDGKTLFYEGTVENVTERVRAQEALKESEELYRTYTEEALVGVYIYQDNRFVFVNPRMEEITGYDREELLRMNPWDIVPDEDQEMVRKLNEARDKGEEVTANYSMHFRRKDGEIRVIELRVRHIPSFGAGGGPANLGNCVDVTEQVRAEEALRESEERYRVLSEGAIVGVYIYRDKRFLYVNDEMAKITGYSRKELLAIDTGELVHEDDREFMDKRVEVQKSSEEVSTRYTMRINRKDGAIVHLMVGARPITYEGEPAFLGNCFDTTESVRAEQALKESEERYRVLSEGAIVGVYIYRDKRFLYVNDEMAKITGYSRKELLAIDTGGLVHEEARDFLDRRASARQSGDEIPSRYTMKIKRKDGETTVLMVGSRPIAYGGQTAYLGNCFDITESVRASQALRESEERYHSFWVNAPVGICLSDSHGRLTMVSPVLCAMTGYAEDELLGMELFELIVEGDERAVPIAKTMDTHEFEQLQSLFSGGPAELTLVKKDGGLLPVEFNIDFITQKGSLKYMITLVADITERKRAQEALRESEERYHTFQANIPVGIFRTTPEGDLISANPALVEMLGYSTEDELKEFKVGDHYVHPEKRREFVDSLGSKGFLTDFEAPMRRKDDSIFWASLNATLVKDERGKGLHIDGTLEDITDRKLAREALRESEEFNRAVIERSPLGVSVRNRYGKLLSCNEAWRRIWAVPEEMITEDLTGEREELKFDERDDYLSEWHDDIRRVYEEGGYLHIPEAELQHPREGGARWVSQHFYAIKDERGEVDRVVIVTEDITDRKDTQKVLATSEETYRSLYETTLALAEETELIDMIAVIADQATGLLDCQQCLFLLLDDTRQVLTPIYSTRPDYSDIIMGFEVPLGVGLSGRVAETGVGLYINAGEADEISVHVEGTDEKEDAQESLISVPMFDGKRILGVITLGKFTGIFDDEDLKRLGVFARQAEIAIKRTRNLEEMAASERTYHSLYETTLALADETDLFRVIEVIAKSASNLLDSRKCIIFLVDEEHRGLRPIYSTREDYTLEHLEMQVGEGLSGHVVETGIGMFVNPGDPDKALSRHIPGTDKEATERESLISVPMFDRKRVLGVITIGRFDAPFAAEDLTKLTVYARQAEIAVKLARHAEVLAKSEETYRSLYNTTSAMANETNPLEVIRIIADQATSLVKANDCTVYRTDPERRVLKPIYSNDPLEKDQIMSFEIPLGEGLSGRVAESGKWATINVEDEDDYSVHVPDTDEEIDKKESVLSVPMFDGKTVIGVLTINRLKDNFTQDDIEKMGIFARQAEIAMLRAESLRALAESEETYHSLYDTTLSLADETDLLRIITIICDQATEQLDSTYCIYSQYDAKEELLIPFYTNAPREREAFMAFKVPLGVGLSGAVARNRLGAYSNYTDEDRPVVNIEGTDDDANDIESVISEPVMDGETLLSVITIGTEEKVYDDEDLAKLRIFARLASIAIKRAENLAALERSRETYRTLYETTMTLADEADPDRVLAGIADNARDLMDAHFCNILSYDPEGKVLIPIYTNAPTSREMILAFRQPLGVGLGGLVAEQRRGAYSNYSDPDRPVVHIEGTDDADEHRESVLAEPIMDSETLLGVFLIHDLDRIFTDDDLAKVRVFARLTSIALKRGQYIQALSESEEKYRSLVEQATDGVIIIQNARFIFANTAMLRMSGYESGEMINQSFLDFIAEEDRPKLRDLYEKRMRGEKIPSIYETTGLHKDGKLIPLELNAGLIQYGGAPADLIIVRDITERKRAEEALRESEERYRSIWTKSPVGICLSDRDGMLTMVNPVLRQMLDFDVEEEFIGRTFFDLLAPGGDDKEVASLLGGKFDTQVYKDELSLFSGKPTEMALVKKSGERLPVEVTIDFITREGSVQYMISLITDITERKKAEESLANYSADLEREVDVKTTELSAARRYLREVIDASADLITVVDAQDRIEILNRAASTAMGYEEEELRGKSIEIFYFDRDRETFKEMTRRLSEGGPSIVRQVDLRCKDGAALTVELSVSPLLDNEGNFTGSVAVGRDIRELEGLRRALLQSEKLAATGKLAANIAHEVNNPLGIITNYLQIAKRDLDSSSDPYRMVGIIEEEVQRIARIISGLLDFYRPESAFLAAADVNQLIEDLLILVSIQLEKIGIEVEKDLAEDLPTVVVSPDQFRQVLLNLVTNAQDAMPDGGTLRIQTRCSEDQVVLSLSDSGGGIVAENLPYIFDPFFTTKGQEGTGLGLSVSYGIIQSFDGIMEASSQPGKGTTITISLPARED